MNQFDNLIYKLYVSNCYDYQENIQVSTLIFT